MKTCFVLLALVAFVGCKACTSVPLKCEPHEAAVKVGTHCKQVWYGESCADTYACVRNWPVDGEKASEPEPFKSEYKPVEESPAPAEPPLPVAPKPKAEKKPKPEASVAPSPDK